MSHKDVDLVLDLPLILYICVRNLVQLVFVKRSVQVHADDH